MAIKMKMKLPNVEPSNPKLVLRVSIMKHHIHFVSWNLLHQMLLQSYSTKNTNSFQKKSSPFYENVDSNALMLENINQLRTRLEDQISKTNALKKKLEELKHENLSLKIELELELDNIKLTINSNNNNKDPNILNNKCSIGSIKPQSTNIINIFQGTVTAAESR